MVKTAATAAHREHKAQSKGRLETRVSGTNPERALETPAWCVQSWAPSNKKPRITGAFMKRLKGLEPSTFCMASRRSSQLSYIRERRQYSRGYARPSRAAIVPATACSPESGLIMTVSFSTSPASFSSRMSMP